MRQPSEKLKAKWAKKLAKSGFIDIENKDGSIKEEIHSRTLDYALNDGRMEYYNQAQDFLNRGKFSSLLDYTVWKMHTEGTSFRTIGIELNLTFYRVRTIVNKVQKLSGIKK